MVLCPARGRGHRRRRAPGPVGGRIVAEVIVGLIKGDRQSYLRQDPDWTPTYGTGGSFTMVDLLTCAGAVVTIPSHRQWPYGKRSAEQADQALRGR